MNKTANYFISGFLLLIVVLPVNAAQPPRWTIELSGGLFEPDAPNWKNYYGRDRMPEISFSHAFRLFTVLDLGYSINYGRDNGKGTLPNFGGYAGQVRYDSIPIDLFAILRLRFSENQWIVPYGGGGYTRFAYQQTIDDEKRIRGSVNGYHARAGIQILLDVLEPDSAKSMYTNYGAINSYLIFEVRQTKAEAGTPKVQIGGRSYKMGIMVEFR